MRLLFLLQWNCFHLSATIVIQGDLSLFGVVDVSHVSIQFGWQNCAWPPFIDNKRRPMVHHYDDLWALCGCCGSCSKWLEGVVGFQSQRQWMVAIGFDGGVAVSGG